MQPKGKLFVLLAVAVAIGLVTATGAFTTVTAQRTATVDVAGDDAALLGLAPANSDNGNEYANTNAGQLKVTLEDLNLNAETTIEEVVNVTNRGSQPVGVWIEKAGDNPDYVMFYNGTTLDNAHRMDNSSTEAQTLGVGQSIQVTIVVDTVGSGVGDGDGLLSTIEVHADASAA